MYQEDYLLRQIRNMIGFIGRIIFKKEENREEDFVNIDSTRLIDDEDIFKLIRQSKIDRAEDILFENVDSEDLDFLKLGLRFYEEISTLSEETLARSNFSKEEIKQGLIDLMKIYEINYIKIDWLIYME